MSVRGLIPLRVAEGQVLHVESMDEGLAQLVCRGRDAFLTLKVTPGVVTYLPGSNPVMTPAPIPEDPCGADAEPTIEPGGTPEEPPAIASPLGVPGAGPESPTVPTGGETGDRSHLLGLWLIFMEYVLTETSGSPEPEYVGTTRVTRLPTEDQADAGYTDHHLAAPGFQYEAGGFSGELVVDYSTYPSLFREWWIYRGPDIVGTDLLKTFPLPEFEAAQAANLVLAVTASRNGPTNEHLGMSMRLAQYSTAGIYTPDDLLRLKPQSPGEGSGHFPDRIETLLDVSIATDVFGGSGFDAMYAAPAGPSNIPLNRFAGPQLIRLEHTDTMNSGASESQVVESRAIVGTGLLSGGTPVNLALTTSVDGTYVGCLIGAAG